MPTGDAAGEASGPVFWAPVTKSEWDAINEEIGRRPKVPEIDWMSRVGQCEITTLHPTTENEGAQATGFNTAGRAKLVGKPAYPWPSRAVHLRASRRMKGEDGVDYLILKVDGDPGQIPGQRSSDSQSQVVMAPALQLIPTPRPTYAVELSIPLESIREDVELLRFAFLDAFQKVTVRLEPKGESGTPDAGLAPNPIGRKIQIAVTLPSPIRSIPFGELVQALSVPRYHEVFLFKLDTPLTGPSVGLAPWTTGHLVVVPRALDRLQYLFDPEFIGKIHVDLFRPISEKWLLSGGVAPENLAPLTSGEAVPAGTAPPDALGGLLFFGLPGEPTQRTPEDEVIQELYPGKTAIQMQLPTGTKFLTVPKGTSAADVERNTGKKWKLYGTDTRSGGQWIYVSVEDDRRALFEAARRNWNDVKMLSRLATVAMDEKYFLEAEQILDRVLQLKPGNFLASSVLAGAKAGTKKLDEAKRILQGIIAARPNQAYPHYLMGQIFLQERNIPAAIESIGRAVRIHPEDRQALNLLFVVYQDELKDETEGLWQLLDLAALYPSSHGPLNFLSAIFSAKNNGNLAVEYARAAFERRQVEDTLSNLSAQLGMAGRVGEVVQLLERYRDLVQKDYRSLGNLATAYEELGSIRKALETLDQMQAVAPPNVGPQIENWKLRLRNGPS